METSKLLFPHKFQPVGYVIWTAGILLLVLNLFFNIDFSTNDIRTLIGQDLRSNTEESEIFTFSPDTGLLYTIAGIMVVLGSLFAGFSRFKIEDDYFEKIRFESMLTSFYLYIIYLLYILLFSWQMAFLFLAVLGCLGTMILYVIVLSIRIIIAKKEAKDEK
jgi:hypothetical protein